MNAIDYFIGQPLIGVPLAALCAFLSLCLVARLWMVHGGDSVVTRVVWSAVLLIPFLGWLFYAAFYRPPERLSTGGHVEYGLAATSGVDPQQPWK